MFVEQMLQQAHRRLKTIAAAAPIKSAAMLMAEPHTDIVIVCDDHGAMVGALTKTDIVRQISRCSGNGCLASVDTIMTCDIVSCRPTDELHDVWATMQKAGLQRVPILDQQQVPIGIIYARDALQNLLDETENVEALMRDYMMNVGYQ